MVSRRLRLFITGSGVLLGLVAVGFLVGTVVTSWDEVSDSLGDANLALVGVAVVLATAAMTAIAVGWRRTLAALGADLPLPSAVARYFVGEIGKYLPGSLWPLIGRGELAARADIVRPVAYGSVGVSLIALYLAAGLLVVALLPFLGDAESGTPLWPLLSIPIGIALLAGGVLDRLRRLAERVLGRELDLQFPSAAASARLVAAYLPSWVLVGAATWAMTRALVPDAEVAPVVAAATLSWLAGFVAVPVPGGVGVREAVFVAAVPDLTVAVATTVALSIRLVFILVDAAGWAIGSAWLARNAGGRSRD